MTAQALEFVALDPAHLDAIQKTHPTTEMAPANIRFAQTAMKDGLPIYCAGLSEVGPGHLIAWGRMGEARPRDLVQIAEQMREVIAGAKRMGFSVKAAGDESRLPWFKKLGFTNFQTVLVAS